MLPPAPSRAPGWAMPGGAAGGPALRAIGGAAAVRAVGVRGGTPGAAP